MFKSIVGFLAGMVLMTGTAIAEEVHPRDGSTWTVGMSTTLTGQVPVNVWVNPGATIGVTHTTTGNAVTDVWVKPGATIALSKTTTGQDPQNVWVQPGAIIALSKTTTGQDPQNVVLNPGGVVAVSQTLTGHAPVNTVTYITDIASGVNLDSTTTGMFNDWSGTKTGANWSGYVTGGWETLHQYNGLTTTDTGTWIDTRKYKSASFQVSGAGTLGAGTGVTIYISSTCTNYSGSGPDNSYHGLQVGSVINADGVYTFEPNGCFMKLRIANNNTPSVWVDGIFRSF